MPASLVESVEARRAELEASLDKLQMALRHWRTWDAEYEGLKEELVVLDEVTGSEAITSIAEAYGGELLTEKEIRELTGIDKNNVRKPQVIVRMIEQRQDYVSQNIATISKQIIARETALDELLDDEIAEEPQSGPALSISEIIEELDDDDNVISSKVQRPEEATAGLLETLRQVGVTDLKSGKPVSPDDEKNHETPTVDKVKAPASISADDKDDEAASLTSRPSGSDPTPVKQEPATGSRPLNESLINGTFKPGDQVIELGDDDEILAYGAILPQNESAEDAQLRREMLQYHLNEVGNVVAEIDLLEGDTDDEFVDELAELDDGMSVTSDVTEEEDEHGRTLGQGVTDNYRQEMRDLEQRLQGRMMANVGPDFSMDGTTFDTEPAEHVETVVLPERKKSNLKPGDSQTGGSKSVRFAEELDISPAPEPQPRQNKKAPKKASAKEAPVNTMANTVMERSTTSAAPSAPKAPKPAKVSRFKQARQPEPEPEPEPAVVQPVLTNTVLERPNTAPAPSPSEADEFDPELQRRQLAARYYELRNDMIRQQGGFRNNPDEIDDGEGPLMEEGSDGKVRKVSRFKAARLQQ